MPDSEWKIRELCKSYRKLKAIDNVSITLNRKQITGLLGVNGAGKSSLFKSMLGLISPDSGASTLPARTSVGYLPDLALLPDSLTASQIVAHAFRVKDAPNQTEAILEEIGLKREAWNERIATYSKGMRQRTALAFALAGNPDWLLLDEPMSGLDAVGRKQLLELLRMRHREGMGMFICSHIVPDLVRLCDRILILSRGRLNDDIEIQSHSMEDIAAIEAKLEQVHAS